MQLHRHFIWLSLLLCAAQLNAAQQTPQRQVVGAFSEGDAERIFRYWQPYAFATVDRHSSYRLVKDAGISVMQASSDDSASGLIRRVDIDLTQFPILSWRWKVTQLPQAENDEERAGDDHAARLYLIFNAPEPNQGLLKKLWRQLSSDQSAKTHAINYIWAHSAALGVPIANPFSTAVMMIPVNRGDSELNRWVEIRRNLLQDYRTAFGADPPRVSAVAIMTDSDNSHSGAGAYYGDIAFATDDNR